VPELGARAIEDYDFLPEHSVFAFDPPDPVVAGWWRDPFTEFGQRYHDGTRWTQYRFIQPSRGVGRVSEVPAEHRPRRPIDDYSPWPLRTNRAMLYAVGCMLGGGLVLALSSALDRNSAAYEWTVRFGLIAVLGALIALGLHSIQFAAHPKELGPRDRSAWFVPAIYVFLIGGILVRSWDDVLRSLWLR
jgi:drug/metabolite transporter (DMT)-like permease